MSSSIRQPPPERRQVQKKGHPSRRRFRGETSAREEGGGKKAATTRTWMERGADDQGEANPLDRAQGENVKRAPFSKAHLGRTKCARLRAVSEKGGSKSSNYKASPGGEKKINLLPEVKGAVYEKNSTRLRLSGWVKKTGGGPLHWGAKGLAALRGMDVFRRGRSHTTPVSSAAGSTLKKRSIETKGRVVSLNSPTEFSWVSIKKRKNHGWRERSPWGGGGFGGGGVVFGAYG